LLSAQQESDLFAIIERGLETVYAKNADAEENLIECAIAYQKVCLSNLRLVIRIAADFQNSPLAKSLDLVQEGSIGLVKAINRFDYRRGFKFSTFAYTTIWGTITHAVERRAAEEGIPRALYNAWISMRKKDRELTEVLGRRPTLSELGLYTGKSTEVVKSQLFLELPTTYSPESIQSY